MTEDRTIEQLTNDLPTIGPKGEWMKKIKSLGDPGDTLYQIIGKDYMKRYGQKNNEQKPSVKRDDIPETITGIHYKFTKHSPWWWLDQMKDSPYVKAGLPGVRANKRDEALATIAGTDAIRNSPAMYECSWQELFDAGREGFLIVIIKGFLDFNEKYEYLKQ
jgi:hypothetical protein